MTDKAFTTFPFVAIFLAQPAPAQLFSIPENTVVNIGRPDDTPAHLGDYDEGPKP